MTVFNRIKASYVDKVDDKKLIRGAIDGEPVQVLFLLISPDQQPGPHLRIALVAESDTPRAGVAVAIALGLGTMIGWRRIVVTVGEKIGKIFSTPTPLAIFLTVNVAPASRPCFTASTKPSNA